MGELIWRFVEEDACPATIAAVDLNLCIECYYASIRWLKHCSGADEYLARILTNLGIAKRSQISGDKATNLDLALRFCKDAVVIHDRLESARDAAETRVNLALVLIDLSRLDEAIAELCLAEEDV